MVCVYGGGGGGGDGDGVGRWSQEQEQEAEQEAEARDTQKPEAPSLACCPTHHAPTIASATHTHTHTHTDTVTLTHTRVSTPHLYATTPSPAYLSRSMFVSSGPSEKSACSSSMEAVKCA